MDGHLEVKTLDSQRQIQGKKTNSWIKLTSVFRSNTNAKTGKILSSLLTQYLIHHWIMNDSWTEFFTARLDSIWKCRKYKFVKHWQAVHYQLIFFIIESPNRIHCWWKAFHNKSWCKAQDQANDTGPLTLVHNRQVLY